MQCWATAPALLKILCIHSVQAWCCTLRSPERHYAFTRPLKHQPASGPEWIFVHAACSTAGVSGCRGAP